VTGVVLALDDELATVRAGVRVGHFDERDCHATEGDAAVELGVGVRTLGPVRHVAGRTPPPADDGVE
jgi:hypothetical protein